MNQPKKAIIAAAGLGTRFLPWTKSMPKEMLPLGNEPVIQHIVDGLVGAGVTQIAIIGGPQKRAIENHFGPAAELENALIAKGKSDLAEQVHRIQDMAHFVYIDQRGEPAGNARPLLNAVDAGFIDEEESAPFYFMFADDFFSAEVSHAEQLNRVYQRVGASVVSLIEIEEPEDADRYGMAVIDETANGDTIKLAGLVEKPGAEERPSDLAAVSGYLLMPEIIPYVRELQPSQRGEIELPEAIGNLARDGRVYGARIEGEWHDAGSPATYAMAVVDYALKDPQSAEAMRRYLTKRLDEPV